MTYVLRALYTVHEKFGGVIKKINNILLVFLFVFLCDIVSKIEEFLFFMLLYVSGGGKMEVNSTFALDR